MGKTALILILILGLAGTKAAMGQDSTFVKKYSIRLYGNFWSELKFSISDGPKKNIGLFGVDLWEAVSSVPPAVSKMKSFQPIQSRPIFSSLVQVPV